MSGTETIERLSEMLRGALDIIQTQAELLDMHGIETLDRGLENAAGRIQREGKALLHDGRENDADGGNEGNGDDDAVQR